MVDVRLVNYIKEQLSHGYDINTIRTFLIKNGYGQGDVDSAIQYLQAGQKRSYDQPSQVKMLVSYVKQYLVQGYSPAQIEEWLVQKGYPEYTVQKAVTKALKKELGFRLPSKKIILVIFLILLIIVSVAGIAWFFMNIDFKETTEVNYDVSIDIDTLAPGDVLYITNDFIDFPDERDYPITIYYTINDKNTLTREDSWQISFSRDEVLEKTTKYGLERTIPAGEYELNAKMNYGTTSKQAYAYFTITVDEEELIVAEEEVVKEESIPEEQLIQDDEKIVEEEVEVTLEMNVITSNDFENYAIAKDLAGEDAVSASQYCEQIEYPSKKDECYSAVARNSGDKEYCAEVISDPTRDACYIDFAFNKGDYTVCGMIANPFIKQSCEQLEQVSQMQG